MEPKLILFDVDGTLVDTAGAGRRAVETAFAEVHHLSGIADAAPDVRFAGMTDPAIFGALAKSAGIDRQTYADRLEALLATYLRALEIEMRRRDSRRRVLPGVARLLRALDARPDVFLGLVTGNLEPGARIKLGAFGLNPYFPDGGFGSDHADRGEVARLAREKLSRRHGIDFAPERIAVIGDTEHDVACARVNGFRAVAVHSGWVGRDVLRAADPDALFDDLADVAAVFPALGLDTDEAQC